MHRREVHGCTLNYQEDPLKEVRNPCKRACLRAITASERNPRTQQFIRSSRELFLERHRQATSVDWWLWHPCSVVVVVWDIAMLLLGIIQLVLVPLSLMALDSDMLIYITLLADMINLLNVAHFFLTGFVDKRTGEIVMDRKRVAVNYAKSYFVMDLLASLPYFFLLMMYRESISIKRALGVLNIFKLFLLRKLTDNSGLFYAVFGIGGIASGACKVPVLLGLFVHWMTALQYALPQIIFQETLENREESWIILLRKKRGYELDAYSASFFRAVSIICGFGYGIHDPVTIEDITVAILTTLFQIIFQAYLLVEIVTLMFIKSSTYYKYTVMTEQVHTYMRQKQVPFNLQKKIYLFYDYKYGKRYYSQRTVRERFSRRIEEDLRFNRCRRVVERSMIFRHLPFSTIRGIAGCLRRQVFLPNEVILKAGMSSEFMYFLLSGRAYVVTRAGREVGHLSDGDTIGDVEFVFKDSRTLTSVLAAEITETYRLDKHDLEDVFPNYEMYHAFLRSAADRIEDSKMAGHSYKSLLLGGLTAMPSFVGSFEREAPPEGAKDDKKMEYDQSDHEDSEPDTD